MSLFDPVMQGDLAKRFGVAHLHLTFEQRRRLVTWLFGSRPGNVAETVRITGAIAGLVRRAFLDARKNLVRRDYNGRRRRSSCHLGSRHEAIAAVNSIALVAALRKAPF